MMELRIPNEDDKNHSSTSFTPMTSGTGPNSPITPNRPDESVRVVFLGAAKVGKTAIIQRFIHNRFETKYIPTVEDVHSKKYVVRNRLVRLVLMDTAGSLDFPAMLRLCIAKASAFVLVFSHDNAESLAQAGHLLQQIKSQRRDYAPLVTMTPHVTTNQHPTEFTNERQTAGELNFSASPPITVVCNKSDLPPAHSQVSESAIMEWLLTNGLKPSQFVYASAKTNESIMAIFKSLWYQNEVTKSITLDTWDGVRRSSLNWNRPRTPPSNPVTDFSALSGSATMGQLQTCGAEQQEKSSHKSRTNLLHNSLRLKRRSSSKSNKCKPDMVQLDCVLS